MTENIQITFTLAERDLILHETFADPSLTDRLKIAEITGDKIKVSYTLDEIEDLADSVVAEANHADERKLEKNLYALFDKLEKIEKKYM